MYYYNIRKHMMHAYTYQPTHTESIKASMYVHMHTATQLMHIYVHTYVCMYVYKKYNILHTHSTYIPVVIGVALWPSPLQRTCYFCSIQALEPVNHNKWVTPGYLSNIRSYTSTHQCFQLFNLGLVAITFLLHRLLQFRQFLVR